MFTDRIKQQQLTFNFRLAWLNTLAALPYAAGWIIGVGWWLVRYFVASFALGFKDGVK